MKAGLSYAHPVRIGSFSQDIATVVTEYDGVAIENVCALAQTRDGTVYAASKAGLWCLPSRTKRKGYRNAVEGIPSGTRIVWMETGPDDTLLIGMPERSYTLAINAEYKAMLSIPALEVNTLCCSLNPSSKRHHVTVTLRDFDPIFLSAGALHFLRQNRSLDLPSGYTGACLCRTTDGRIWVGTDNGLLLHREGQWKPIALLVADADASAPAYNSHEPYVHAVACDVQGGVWAATDSGLFYVTQAGSLLVSGKEGLPLTRCTCLALGPEGDLWAGSNQGVALLSEGIWRYYAGRRWLPDDRVNAILPLSDGSAWIGTEGGLSHLAFSPMTWARKARHYERVTAARHNRDGYVTECRLTAPGDLNSFLLQASDNDGLWTALYLAAQCFHYATTGESAPRKRARHSLHALLDLVRLTGIEGFPARAIIRRNETVEQSDPGPNWYPSPIDPDVLYKNDTSSDEVDGHYLAWYLYAELVADAEERREIAAVCRAVTNHILNNNYTLVGPTGKATRWGVWSPEKLNHDSDWRAERGLNSLEMLSHLKVATYLCGDERFAAAYQTLIEQHGYALNTVTQKMMPPEAECNHSDDELAACAYYPLLRLETDPALRALFLWSLERTHTILRAEHSPFYNILYGALTGKPCQAEAAAARLRDAPHDLRLWTMENSHRPDVAFRQERDRFGMRQLRLPLSPREKAVMKWNHNPYLANDGDGGQTEMDGAFWLLPFWMARYHGILRPGKSR